MIQKATAEHLPILAQLACKLWPENTPEDLQGDFSDMISDPHAACFLAYVEEHAIGFAQCQLRHDYVEGTDSSPVGYLEGIFVDACYRKRGIAKQLLFACQAWAKSMGCSEFASDCELSNAESLQFHLNVGFEEANRIICFTKKL